MPTTITAYTFGELTPEAQGRALKRHRDMSALQRVASLAGIIQNICEIDLEYQGAGRMERAEAHFDGTLFDAHGNILEH